jgi:hypothetical protein
MNCTPKKHLYDVAEDGQTATCLCGEGEPIHVPDAPEWAGRVADLVPPSEWQGKLDEWDLDNVEWTAEIHDHAYDGSCECWAVKYGTVELQTGDLTVTYGDTDQDTLPEIMRAMCAAHMVFNEAMP